MNTEFTIRCATWKQDADILKEIRKQVFIMEQGVPANMEWDDHDQDARHLLALNRNCEPIGTARLLNSGQIGRIAVLEHYRNRGIGKALLQNIVSVARENDFSSVFLHAQTPVVPFYRNLGFTLEGRPFLEAGIEHYLMRKALQGTIK